MPSSILIIIITILLLLLPSLSSSSSSSSHGVSAQYQEIVPFVVNETQTNLVISNIEEQRSDPTSPRLLIHVTGYLCSTCRLTIGPNIDVTMIFIDIAVDHRGGGRIEFTSSSSSTKIKCGNVAIFLHNFQFCPPTSSSGGSSSTTITAGPHVEISLDNLELRADATDFAVLHPPREPKYQINNRTNSSFYDNINDYGDDSSSNRLLRTQALLDIRLDTCASAPDAADSTTTFVGDLLFDISVTNSGLYYNDDFSLGTGDTSIAPFATSIFYTATNSSRVSVSKFSVKDSNFVFIDPRKFEFVHHDIWIAGIWFDWSTSPELFRRDGSTETNSFHTPGVPSSNPVQRAYVAPSALFEIVNVRIDMPARYGAETLAGIGFWELSGDPSLIDTNPSLLRTQNVTVFFPGFHCVSTAYGIYLDISNFRDLSFTALTLLSPNQDSSDPASPDVICGGSMLRGTNLFLQNISGTVSCTNCEIRAGGDLPYMMVFFSVASAIDVNRIAISGLSGGFSCRRPDIEGGRYRYIGFLLSAGFANILRDNRRNERVVEDTSVREIELWNLDLEFTDTAGMALADFTNVTMKNGFTGINIHDTVVRGSNVLSSTVFSGNNTWALPSLVNPNSIITIRPNITLHRVSFVTTGPVFSFGFIFTNIGGLGQISVTDCVMDTSNAVPKPLSPSGGISITSGTILMLVSLTGELYYSPTDKSIFPQPQIIMRRNKMNLMQLGLLGVWALVPAPAANRGFKFDLNRILTNPGRSAVFNGDITLDSNEFIVLPAPAGINLGLLTLNPIFFAVLAAEIASPSITIRNETWIDKGDRGKQMKFFSVINFPPGIWTTGALSTAENDIEFFCPASTLDGNVIKQLKVADKSTPNGEQFRPVSGNQIALKGCLGPGTRTKSPSKSNTQEMTFTLPKTRTSRTATFSRPYFVCSSDSFVTCSIKRYSEKTAEALHFRRTRIDCRIDSLPSSDSLFSDASKVRDRFQKGRLSQFSDFGLRISQALGDTNGATLLSQIPQQNIWVYSANVSTDALSVTIELSIGPQKFDKLLDIAVDVQFLPSAFQCDSPPISNQTLYDRMQLYNNISTVLFKRAFSSVPVALTQTITSLGAVSMAASGIMTGAVSPGALGLQRMVHVQQMFVSCSGAHEQFEILDSPFQMAIGSEESPSRYALGAVVGNAILNLAVLLLSFAAAAYRSQAENVAMMKVSNLDATRIPSAFFVSSIILLCGSTVGFFRVVQLSGSGLEIAVAVVLYASLSLSAVGMIAKILLPPRSFWKNVKVQTPNPELAPEKIQEDNNKIMKKHYEKKGAILQFDRKMKQIELLKKKYKQEDDRNKEKNNDGTVDHHHHHQKQPNNNANSSASLAELQKLKQNNNNNSSKEEEEKFKKEKLKEQKEYREFTINSILEDDIDSSLAWHLRIRRFQRYLFYPSSKWVSAKKGSKFVSRFGPSVFDDCRPEVYYAHFVDIIFTIFVSICEAVEIPDHNRGGCEAVSFVMCIAVVSVFAFTLIWQPWSFRHQTMIALLINGLATISVFVVCYEKVFVNKNDDNHQESGGGGEEDRSASDVAQIIFLAAMIVGTYDMLVNAVDLIGDAFLSLKPNSKMARRLRSWFGDEADGDDNNNHSGDAKSSSDGKNSSFNQKSGNITNNSQRSFQQQQQFLKRQSPHDKHHRVQLLAQAIINQSNNEEADELFENAAVASSRGGLLLSWETDPRLKNKTNKERLKILQERKKFREEMEKELAIDDDDDIHHADQEMTTSFAMRSPSNTNTNTNINNNNSSRSPSSTLFSSQLHQQQRTMIGTRPTPTTTMVTTSTLQENLLMDRDDSDRHHHRHHGERRQSQSNFNSSSSRRDRMMNDRSRTTTATRTTPSSMNRRRNDDGDNRDSYTDDRERRSRRKQRTRRQDEDEQGNYYQNPRVKSQQRQQQSSQKMRSPSLTNDNTNKDSQQKFQEREDLLQSIVEGAKIPADVSTKRHLRRSSSSSPQQQQDPKQQQKQIVMSAKERRRYDDI